MREINEQRRKSQRIEAMKQRSLSRDKSPAPVQRSLVKVDPMERHVPSIRKPPQVRASTRQRLAYRSNPASILTPPLSPPKSPVNKPAQSPVKRPLQSSVQSPALRLLKNASNRQQLNLSQTKPSPKAVKVPPIAIKDLNTAKRPNLVEPVKR